MAQTIAGFALVSIVVLLILLAIGFLLSFFVLPIPRWIVESGNQSDTMAAVNWPNVILYGDSLTQFSYSELSPWAALLADRLARKCDVLNRGFSGYNTRWNRIMLPRLFTKDNTKDTVAFVVFLGANDSNKEEWEKQHVPLPEYKENLIKIVQYMESIDMSKDQILLVGPPACNAEAWADNRRQQGMSSYKDNALARNYSRACQEAARESGVEFVDVHTAMVEQPDSGNRFLLDGLHFNKEGATFVEKLIWSMLHKRTDHLQDIMPLHSEVDNKNPEAALLP